MEIAISGQQPIDATKYVIDRGMNSCGQRFVKFRFHHDEVPPERIDVKYMQLHFRAFDLEEPVARSEFGPIGEVAHRPYYFLTIYEK